MLESPKIKDKDKKAGSVPASEAPQVKKLYPAGKPVRLEEREWSKLHRPKSMSAGEYLCWDYSTHAGCGERNEERQKGEHEMMSTFGLHGSILMQLERRGGHRSGRKIRPGEAGGYLQAIRDSMMQEIGKTKPEVPFKKAPSPVWAKTDAPAIPPKAVLNAPPLKESTVLSVPNKPVAEMHRPKIVEENKAELGKPAPKKIWKPKARAAGQQITEATTMSDAYTPDVVVRKFGSGKHLNPDEAAATAAKRASAMQIELGMCPTETKSSESMGKSPSTERGATPEKTAVMFANLLSTGMEESAISTRNPFTGGIPDLDKTEMHRQPCLWGRGGVTFRFPTTELQ